MSRAADPSSFIFISARMRYSLWGTRYKSRGDDTESGNFGYGIGKVEGVRVNVVDGSGNKSEDEFAPPNAGSHSL